VQAGRPCRRQNLEQSKRGCYLLVQASLSTPTLIRRNRRAYPRLGADQLQWVDRVRLTYGPSVSLIDLSVHGAFFEVDYRLRPGEATDFELVALDERTMVTGHIVRAEISGLSGGGVRYRGACTFDRPLPWSRLSVPEPPPALPVVQSAEYQPWGGWSEIRLAFRHGRRLHGYTRGFHSSASALNLWPSPTASDRERQTVPLSLIRTVIFVRDLADDGSPARSQCPAAPSLQPVEVTFRNRDMVRGAILGYNPGEPGFWIFPPPPPELARVFAVSSAVREICLF
jgi:hypothetical protein